MARVATAFSRPADRPPRRARHAHFRSIAPRIRVSRSGPHSPGHGAVSLSRVFPEDGRVPELLQNQSVSVNENMPEPSLEPTTAGAAPDECRITAYRLGYSADLWIVPASGDRDWMEATKNGWANRCLPLRVANQAGWLVLNDCEFEATWTGQPQLDSIRIKFRDGRKSIFVSSMFGYGIITWEITDPVRTAPGYNLLARS